MQRSDDSIQSWSHAVCWEEIAHLSGGRKTVRAVHVLRSDETRGAAYEVCRKEPFPRVEASGVFTTPEAFCMYLRGRLLDKSNGQAAREVYEVLGAIKPRTEVQVTPEVESDTEELYRRAAVAMATPVADLKKKYGHLNPGLQAMNLRNRLRAKGQVV